MTNSDEPRPHEAASTDLVTALLVLRQPVGPATASVIALLRRLDEAGVVRGHQVGPIVPLTAHRREMSILADYVAASRHGERPTGAEDELLDLLAATVDDLVADEGAETFQRRRSRPGPDG